MKTKEEWRTYHKEWRKKNRDKVSAANKKYYANNVEFERSRTAKYCAENPEWVKEQVVKRTKRYQTDSKHREYILQKGKESRGRRKESIARFERKRQQENPGKYKAIRRNNELQRALRVPSWADQHAINFFYECCPEGFEIDHIIPLRGELISGLHVETNLQWLTRDQNRVKSNKYAS